MSSNTDTGDRIADHACLVYTDRDSIEGIRTAQRWLEREPDVVHRSVAAAAVAGHVEAMEDHLERNPALGRQVCGPRGWVPLLYVCYTRLPEQRPQRDHIEVTKLLLEAGADPNAFWMWGDTYRFTALTGAMGEGEQGVKQQPPHPRSRELAELLLEAGADPADGQGLYNTHFTPGNEWIELLLAHGLNKEHRVNWPIEPAMRLLDFLLGQAVQSDHLERARLLLEHGADAASRNSYNGRTHLENARLAGAPEMTALLRRNGAPEVSLSPAEEFEAACLEADGERVRRLQREHPDFTPGTALLKRAASLNRIEAVKLLLEMGVDLDGKDAGATVLHQAAWDGNLPLARLLIDRGARLIHDDRFSATPVGWAAHAGREEMVALLLEHADDVFDLVEHARADRLRSLLERDPSLATRCDPRGNSLLHDVRAEPPVGDELLRLLVRFGVDVNRPHHQGATPLDRAIEEGIDHRVRTLTELGATSGRGADDAD